jgi:transposase
MAARHSDEFNRDAVRISLTSGLTIRQVASDLGIGLSTLGKWVWAISEEAKAPAQDAGLLRETERLRKENHILKGGREVPKKRRCSSRHKNREVSIHCRLSWRADAQPSVSPDGGFGSRALRLEAPAAVASAPARHGAPGPYLRSAPHEPGRLRQTSHDRGVEQVGPAR